MIDKIGCHLGSLMAPIKCENVHENLIHNDYGINSV